MHFVPKTIFNEIVDDPIAGVVQCQAIANNRVSSVGD